MKRISPAVIFVLLYTFILIPSFSYADEAHYFYDNAGRLVRVLKGSEGLVYQYDKVGNLLSITKGTVGTGAPVLQSINPDVLFIGSTTLVTIKGQNLFTTKSITCDNTSVIIRVLNVTDTEIKTEITVSPDAIPGTTVNITVTTLYGSASIQATLTSSKLTFSPGQLALAPGSSGGITASIFPSIGKSLTITLNNSNPSVASVPQFVTIPSNGTASFTVNAIKEGIAVIDSGSPTTVVFVTKAFSPLPGEEVVTKAGPISVYIATPSPANTTTSSLPVSVYIETPLSANTTTSSLPVSVYIETPTSSNTTTSSLPVSVYIEQPSGNSTVVSLPVSTKISPP